MLIEVAVSSLEDALAAESLGAGRLEISSSLCLGGLTPSYGLVKTILEHVSIPVIVLIRSRSGDFVYSENEMEVMRNDVRQFRSLGIHGYAFGALTPDGKVQQQACQWLINEDPKSVWVFHRAFDFCNDPDHALHQLSQMGFSRVMTSGQSATAWEGRFRIRAWVASGTMPILPAGGIRADRVRELVQCTGCDEIHVGMRESLEPSNTANQSISLTTSMPPSAMHSERLDASSLKTLVDVLRKCQTGARQPEDAHVKWIE